MTSLPHVYILFCFCIYIFPLAWKTPAKLYSSFTHPQASHVTHTHEEPESLIHMYGTDCFFSLPIYKNDFLQSALTALLSFLPGEPTISFRFNMTLISHPPAHVLRLFPLILESTQDTEFRL